MPKRSLRAAKSLVVFEAYKQAINRALQSYCQTLGLKFAGQELPFIANQAIGFIVEYTLRPGKRVRGTLAAASYDAINGTDISENGLKLAVAMELIQSYLLIVDDVTDMSDLRRGKPTVHRLYEEYYKGSIRERDAEQLAFYTGMIVNHIVNLVLLELDETAEHINATLRRVSENIIFTGFGQLDDIMQEITREASEDDIIRKYSLKTSHYTFTNPLHAGMALAGVNDETAFKMVSEFGEPAGVAFQAHDDYLGIFGGTETGKSNSDDIKEGKLTLLMQFALNNGTEEQITTLKRYLGNPDIGAQETNIVRAILESTGATMEARQTAERYARIAIEALTRIPIWGETFKSQLVELVIYSISRKS